MNVSDAIRTILKVNNGTQRVLAEKAEVSLGSISSMLNRGNPRLNVLNKVVGAMGYKVVLAPESAVPFLPDTCLVVESSEKSDD